MENESITGICFCNDLNGLPNSPETSELGSYSKTFNNVSIIWYESDLSLLNSYQLSNVIQNNKLDRIIIIGKQPGHIKSFFSKAMRIAGNDPCNVFLASLNQFNLQSTRDTVSANIILASAIHYVSLDSIAQKENGLVNSNPVVFGAEIAGIQTALEIADSDNKVYLVEKEASIGGHMAMLDRKLPALDYAACILTSNRIQVDQRLNIELLT